MVIFQMYQKVRNMCKPSLILLRAPRKRFFFFFGYDRAATDATGRGGRKVEGGGEPLSYKTPFLELLLLPRRCQCPLRHHLVSGSEVRTLLLFFGGGCCGGVVCTLLQIGATLTEEERTRLDRRRCYFFLGLMFGEEVATTNWRDGCYYHHHIHRARFLFVCLFEAGIFIPTLPKTHSLQVKFLTVPCPNTDVVGMGRQRGVVYQTHVRVVRGGN